MTAAATAPFGRRARPPAPPPGPTAPLNPGDSFAVPVEMVLHQTNATGLMFLRRAKEKGATFARRAVVWRVGDRLLGRVDFLVPVGPEKWCEQVVQLTTHLWESL